MKKHTCHHHRNDNVIPFDIDDTLIVWGKDHNKPGKGKIAFKDPYTPITFYLRPHHVHIRLLKQFKGRGFEVIVWSKQGDRWANEVITKLGLKDYVDHIFSKPEKYVDDKENVADVIGTRIYFKDKAGR